MYLVDSHCHLDYPDFAEEGVDAVVARARSAGVGYLLTICTQISAFPLYFLHGRNASASCCRGERDKYYL